MLILDMDSGKQATCQDIKNIPIDAVIGITFGAMCDWHSLIDEACIEQYIEAKILSWIEYKEHITVSLLPIYGGGKVNEFALYNSGETWFCMAYYKNKGSVFKNPIEFEVMSIVLEEILH